MGADSKESNFDLNSCFSSPNSFSDLLTGVSLIDDVPKKLSALNDYVYFLEQELVKVAVFRRELPLSVNLLNDAILRLKEEAMNLQRKKIDEDMDKKSWLSSVQLWTDPAQCEKSSDVLSGGNHHLNKKGGVKREVMDDFSAADGLSLSIPVAAVGDRNAGEDDISSEQQQSKKQRRCWSQELHQSFVNALFKLGGSQAATPKQIREIMQVDGLTNDEVKSHLQKYRLYVRKMQPRGAGAVMAGSPEGPLHIGGGQEDAKSDNRSWGRFSKAFEV